MAENHWPSAVGIFGLGIMGSSIAGHLAAAGRTVIGYEPDPARAAAAAAKGVTMVSAAEAATAELLLTSLPSAGALDATTDAVAGARRPHGQILAELSTLSLETKTSAAKRLAAAGVTMLDCPLSGTGAQAADRDLVVFVSGDETAGRRCNAVLADFSRAVVYLGAFGNGTKMKFVANLLVAIHNVAAAEAISLGIRAGLDPTTLVDILSAGAGNSRMLQVRGPMMARDVYQPATMTLDVWRKDMRLIKAFAGDVGSATPLFDATAPLYEDAVTAGRGRDDTAAVRTVIERLSEGMVKD